jgi:hypothetical protein
MMAHGFQIIYIVVDASGQLGGIADVIRPAAITKIVNDQRSILREALEIIDHMKSIGDDDRLRAASDLLKEKPHSIAGG